MPRLVRKKAAVSIDPVGLVKMNDYVHDVAFSSDGTLVAACSASGQVAVWDVPALTPASELAGHEHSALAIGWRPDSHCLASGGQDGVLRLWDVDTGEERSVHHIGAQKSWVDQLSWDTTGQHLAASAGKTLKVWRVSEYGLPQPAGELSSHQSTVSALLWAPGGKRVISACYGGAGLWDVEGGPKPLKWFSYEGAVLSLALHPSGEYLASGNLDGSVHLWRTDTDQQWQMSGYPMKVTAVAFNSTGQHLFTASGPALVVWNMHKFEGSSGRLCKGHLGWIQDIACHPEKPVAATVGEDGILCIWDASSIKPQMSHEANKQGGLSCAAWSRHEDWLATGAPDGTVSLFMVKGIDA